MAEVESARPGSHDQRVITKFKPLVELQHPARRIQVYRFSQQHLCIPLPAQNRSQGRSNFAGRERSCRHLVQQRLK